MSDEQHDPLKVFKIIARWFDRLPSQADREYIAKKLYEQAFGEQGEG